MLQPEREHGTHPRPKRDTSRTPTCLAPPSPSVALRRWLRTPPEGGFGQVVLYGYGPAQVGFDPPLASCPGLAAPFETKLTMPAAHTVPTLQRSSLHTSIAGTANIRSPHIPTSPRWGVGADRLPLPAQKILSVVQTSGHQNEGRSSFTGALPLLVPFRGRKNRHRLICARFALVPRPGFGTSALRCRRFRQALPMA
jgi:hypothetical protein